jgi:insertion element IS1 protein InsB
MEQAGEAAMDERWSVIGTKKEQRGLWHAIDDHTGAVLAYVFGHRKDEVFLQGKALREPLGRTRFSPDHWDAYTRHLASEVPSPGKRHT